MAPLACSVLMIRMKARSPIRWEFALPSLEVRRVMKSTHYNISGLGQAVTANEITPASLEAASRRLP